MKQCYDTANDPRYADVCLATSHLTGKTINRCTHIHHSVDDLLKKQLMTRLICHRVGGCMQRCMGSDALNALFSVTYDCDQACGTEYRPPEQVHRVLPGERPGVQLRPDRREGLPQPQIQARSHAARPRPVCPCG